MLNLIDTPVSIWKGRRAVDLSFKLSTPGSCRFCMGSFKVVGGLSGCPSTRTCSIPAPLFLSLITTSKVDASQGVQAQSISVFHDAKGKGLTIIPVLNKVSEVVCHQRSFQTYLGRQTFQLLNQNEQLHRYNPLLVSIPTTSSKSLPRLAKVQSTFWKPLSIASLPQMEALLHLSKGFCLIHCEFHKFHFYRIMGVTLFSSYDKYRGVISLVNVQQGVLRKGGS